MRQLRPALLDRGLHPSNIESAWLDEFVAAGVFEEAVRQPQMHAREHDDLCSEQFGAAAAGATRDHIVFQGDKTGVTTPSGDLNGLDDPSRLVRIELALKFHTP